MADVMDTLGVTKYQVVIVGLDGSRKIIAGGFDSQTEANCWAFSHQHQVFERLVAEPANRNLRPQGATRAARAGLL